METYCISCKKTTANENSSIRKTKRTRLMLLSNGAEKYRLSLKIKNLTILIMFEMISLK